MGNQKFPFSENAVTKTAVSEEVVTQMLCHKNVWVTLWKHCPSSEASDGPSPEALQGLRGLLQMFSYVLIPWASGFEEQIDAMEEATDITPGEASML